MLSGCRDTTGKGFRLSDSTGAIREHQPIQASIRYVSIGRIVEKKQKGVKYMFIV